MKTWQTISTLSHREIIALQESLLRRFIQQHVYPFSPYYRQLFDSQGIDPKSIKTLADLTRIPFTDKTHFALPDKTPRYQDFILQPDINKIKAAWPKSKLLSLAWQKVTQGEASVKQALSREYRPIFMTFTTGTTSTPVAFTYSRLDIDNLYLSGSRMLDLFHLKEEERIINMFPFAPHLAFWQTFFGALEGGRFALSTGGGKVMGTEGNIQIMMRMKPAMLIGVPSYIYHLVRFAQEKNLDLSFVKKIVLGAAKVTVGYKQKLANMLASQGAKQVEVFGTYGFTEARCAWAECPTSNDISSGYHLYPDREIFEVIDPQTGAVKGPGEDGELVYTPLDARASVVLRYRTGDFVKGGIEHKKCPYCGCTTLILSSNISRLSDTKDLQLSKIKGTLINLNHFGSVLNDIPEIDEWQIEIRKHNNDPFEVDEVIVYVTSQKNANQEALLPLIKDKLVGNSEVSPNDIKFIPLDEMLRRLELETANKEKRIVDNRPKG